MRLHWLLMVGGCSFTSGASSTTPGDATLGDDARDAAATDGGQLDAQSDAAPPDAYVCSTAGLDCATGTTAEFSCNSECWVSCTSVAPFSDQPTVAQACVAWGGKLAPIRSAADEACVSQTIFPMQASWIGFEQALNQATPSAGWSWNGDGLPVTYTDWASGQPNDGDSVENNAEQCAYMPTAGTWQDTPCTGTMLYRFSCVHD